MGQRCVRNYMLLSTLDEMNPNRVLVESAKLVNEAISAVPTSVMIKAYSIAVVPELSCKNCNSFCNMN